MPVRKACSVIRILTDENFDGDIFRGLVRRMPSLDVVRVQDVGLTETPDPTILAWAAAGQPRQLPQHIDPHFLQHVVDRIVTPQPLAHEIAQPLPVARDQLDKRRFVAGLAAQHQQSFIEPIGVFAHGAAS